MVELIMPRMLQALALSILLLVAIPIYSSSNFLAQSFPQMRGVEMSQIKISVCIDEAHLNEIEKIAQQLQAAGAIIEQSLPSIGIINAAIAADQVDRLYQIEGVQQVERQEVYQIAPPHSQS
jgi:hypothetical protein